MPGFDYPADASKRKHGPRGYSQYASYHPWLRDEFTFRCVYCLLREQWGRVIGQFDIDHFVPQARAPDQAANYDNLIYSCSRCNLIKSAQIVPDAAAVLTAGDVRVLPDGILECFSDDAESIVWKLDLNSPEMISWRLLWIRIIELAREHDAGLHEHLMRFPDDLPDLDQLKPPDGNSRPEGIAMSYHSQRLAGTLPSIY